MSKKILSSKLVNANKHTTRYIVSKMGENNLSLTEVGKAAGYNHSIISNILSERMKVPINKFSVFAKAVGGDPAYMFRLILKDMLDDTTFKEVEDLGIAITQNERKIIDIIREEADFLDVAPSTPEQTEELKALVRKWKADAELNNAKNTERQKQRSEKYQHLYTKSKQYLKSVQNQSQQTEDSAENPETK